MIKKCDCPPAGLAAKFQEETYGKGMRVQNEMKAKDGNKPTTRCTICGKVNS